MKKTPGLSIIKKKRLYQSLHMIKLSASNNISTFYCPYKIFFKKIQAFGKFQKFKLI